MGAGELFHYNKDSPTYGVARDAATLFQEEDGNPLINEMGVYILDKLSMFQNMQGYKVTATTNIDHNDVRESRCTLLVDGTKIYRFSKDLLTYIEMCVAFSLYYRQDDPRWATHFWRHGHLLQERTSKIRRHHVQGSPRLLGETISCLVHEVPAIKPSRRQCGRP
jgi:hypothetical protein